MKASALLPCQIITLGPRKLKRERERNSRDEGNKGVFRIQAAQKFCISIIVLTNLKLDINAQ